MARNLIFIMLISLVLLSGCTSKSLESGTQKELLIRQNTFDLDEDQLIDYSVFTFSTINYPSVKSSSTRQLFVTTQYAPESILLNSVNLSTAVQLQSYFNSYISQRTSVESSCNAKLGLNVAGCSSSKSCADICSSSSVQCKSLVNSYGDFIGDSLLLYQSDFNDLKSTEAQVSSLINKLPSISTEQQTDLLNKLFYLKNKIIQIKTNPLVTLNSVKSCDMENLSEQNLLLVTSSLANYTLSPSSYRYNTLLLIAFNQATTDSNLKSAQASFTDIIPSTLSASMSSILVSPSTTFTAGTHAGSSISSHAIKPLPPNTVSSYSFISTAAPVDALTQIQSPNIIFTISDLGFASSIGVVYSLFFSITSNFYVSFSLALTICLIILWVLFQLIYLVYNLITASQSNQPFGSALRSTFGRIKINWKADLFVAIGAFIFGLLVSFVSTPANASLDFLSIIDLAFSDFKILVSLALFSLGFMFVYFAFENKVKVFLMEKYYGRAIYEEKNLNISRATELKSSSRELKSLLDVMTKENFDVGNEYEILTPIPEDRINTLSAKADSYSRKVIDEELFKVEDTLRKLQERRKLAIERWPLWEKSMSELFSENVEVSSSSLTFIPSPLRDWALKKYLSAHSNENVSLSGETLKRKTITAEKTAETFVNKGLVHGCVIIRDNKISFSSLTEGSSTMFGVLSFKLIEDLKSLPKYLSFGVVHSSVSVGEKYVFALIRQKTIDSVLILEKPKFKEAIEEWKTKMKGF
ncbi:MAG: hypothetical protein AABX38_03430 [Candidatus Micrarchaeota archaeon]